MPPNFRTIVFEKQFEAEFAAIEPDEQQRQELMEGFDGFFSRVPNKGRQIPGSHVWLKEVSDVARGRRLFIYYTFNKEVTVLLSVQHVTGPIILVAIIEQVQAEGAGYESF